MFAAGCGRSDPPQSTAPSTAPPTPPPPVATGPNAADEYRAVMAALKPADIEQLEARNPLTDESESRLPPQRLEELQPIIEQIKTASRMERCDFGIDYSDWPDIDLAQFAVFRTMARLLRAETHAGLDAGDAERAAEALAAQIRLSRQVGGQTLLEATLAYGILAGALETIIEHDDEWQRQQQARLHGELSLIDQADPFGGTAMVEWDAHKTRDHFAGPPYVEGAFQSRDQVRTMLMNAMAVVQPE